MQKGQLFFPSPLLPMGRAWWQGVPITVSGFGNWTHRSSAKGSILRGQTIEDLGNPAFLTGSKAG